MRCLSFSYDDVGRLRQSAEYKGTDGSLTYRQVFDFDRFGNMYRKAANNPSTGQANPLPFTQIEESDISKATNRFTTQTTYDEAGNVVSDAKFRGMGFGYDANGRMVKATKANVPDGLSVYDAAGMRVAERVNDVWRFSVYDIGGKIVAEYGGPTATDEGGVKYILSDWQGSNRAVLSNTGNVRARVDYTAYGENIGAGTGLRTNSQGFDSTINPRQQYGLTERDSATGLDHTWFRKNEGRAGRWTSPDPYLGSMSVFDPQSFNRNAYVQNDPVNFIDPSGLQMVVRRVCHQEVRTAYVDGQFDSAFLVDVCQMELVDVAWGEEIGGGGGMPQEDACDRALSAAKANRSGLLRALDNYDTLLSAAHGDRNWANLLAAVGIRESKFKVEDENGGGKGRGVFQIDLGQNPGVSEEQANDIAWAAQFVMDSLSTVNSRALDAGMSPVTSLMAAVFSHNAGSRKVVVRDKKGHESATQLLINANRQGTLDALNNHGTTDPSYVTQVLNVYLECF